MAGKKKESGEKTHSGLDLSSRFWKTMLVTLAALFTFSGPYVLLVLNRAFDLDYAFSMVSGIAVSVIGLALIWYVIKRNIVS